MRSFEQGWGQVMVAMTDELLPTSLYRCFDGDDRLLYVGITERRFRRMTDHSREKIWWPSIRRTEWEHFPSRAEALVAERKAIQDDRPLHNVQHVVRVRPKPSKPRIEGFTPEVMEKIEKSVC